MARNRMIKPEFFTSAQLSDISIQACHMFAGLWCFSDDRGVYQYSDRKVLGEIYPLRKKIGVTHIKKWVSELKNCGVVIHVTYKNCEYLVITYWDEHQKVDHPSVKYYLENELITEIKELFFENCGKGIDSVMSRDGLATVSVMKEKEKDNKKEKEKEKGSREFVAPSLDDVKNFFRENGYADQLAEKFHKGYEAANWHDSQGNPVRNWKQKAIHVWFKDDVKQKESTSDRFDRIFAENDNNQSKRI